ncbi:conjugal transfer mating-pair stabilization protein TraG [Pseudomonadota bacterium]
MTLAVYTYSNGDVAKEVFNAIATFFATDSFASMLQICAMFAVLATACHFFMTRDHNAIPKWAAVYLLVPLLLINTKTGIQIIDLTDPSGNYAVANVPMIVAAPTYLSSAYMYGVTTAVESVFHAPSDEQYSKTGMVFGAKLYQLSRQSQLEDSQLKGHWLHYMQSCIRGDINLNQKYTWEQLANAPDIFAFLAAHNPSPLRRIQMGPNDFPTCKDALPRLKAGFDTDAQQALSLMANKLYANKVAANQARFTTGLQGSYAKYANISRTASQITTQNMAINAIRNGLADGASVNNNTAAAFNYAYTQNKMQQTSMWTGMTLQAREFLPMMQSILFLLFGCVSFLVVALAMLPSMTFMVLSNYVKGFVYLGTWPILFALINFIMTTRLSLSTSAVANLYTGITLSNVDAMAEMHSRYAAMTGMLMMSVPIICGFIVKGGGQRHGQHVSSNGGNDEQHQQPHLGERGQWRRQPRQRPGR